MKNSPIWPKFGRFRLRPPEFDRFGRFLGVPAVQRAVGYVRVSTEEQVDVGLSLEAQKAALSAYATMRGLELVELIEERGVSAGKAMAVRPGGARLIDAVDRGRVSSVIAVKLDRLFRDAQDCLAVTRAWERKGVALHLVDLGGQAVDTSTAMGQFFLLIMSGVAEMERGLIRERTKAALRHKRALGEKTGGTQPFGYRVGADGKHLIADEAEQALMKRARELRGKGWTLAAIADQLNADRVPSRGKRWYPASVTRLIGKRRHD